MKRTPWTKEETAVLRSRYPDELTVEIARDLGRTVQSCYEKAKHMGLTKSDEFFGSDKSGRTDGTRGMSSRFVKGCTPWSKGKVGLDVGGRSHETRFKKGGRPHNHQPIGSERINSDGIRQRKVTDTGCPPRDWKSIHKLMWEKEHGRVPKNHVVVFKDGDRKNIVLGNLECISRSELMRRNSVQNMPKELATLVQLRGVLTRQINKRENNEKRD